MRKEKDGSIVYESLNELISKGIEVAYKHRNFYYIKLKTNNVFDEVMWKVNRLTGKVVDIHCIDFFDVMDESEKIDPKSLRLSNR